MKNNLLVIAILAVVAGCTWLQSAPPAVAYRSCVEDAAEQAVRVGLSTAAEVCTLNEECPAAEKAAKLAMVEAVLSCTP